jgi:ankyrin repeat protein
MNTINTTRIEVAPATQLFDYIQNRESEKALNYIDNMRDKQFLSVVDSHKMTALMYACKYSLHGVALKILSSGYSNPSQVNESGKTALIYSCSNELSRLAILIIDNGNFKPSQVDEDSCTALMWCCANLMTEVAIKLILTTNNLSYKQQDNDGDTALMIACSKNLETVTLVMIQSGKSRPDIANDDDETPLMAAIQNGMIETSMKLIQTGESAPETVNKYKQTALIIACREKNHELTEEESKSLDIIILELLKTNCGIEHVDEHDQSAFDYFILNYFDDDNISTARFGNTEILLTFVQYYYNQNQTSEIFLRTMGIICNTPLLKAIVRHGVPGIQIDKYCKPPVHAEDVSFVPHAEAKYDNAAYYNTRGNKRKIDSTVDVEEIHSATAIPENDDHYINDNGQRVQIPLMSTGEGQLIPKRPLGGKRRKTCKKMKRGKRGKITRKKTNKKMKKGKKSKITRKKRIKN